MPIYDFSCDKCGKEFEKILKSADISGVICPSCNSGDIRKVVSSVSYRLGRKSSSVPAGALQGGSCKSGFS